MKTNYKIGNNGNIYEKPDGVENVWFELSTVEIIQRLNAKDKEIKELKEKVYGE